MKRNKKTSKKQPHVPELAQGEHEVMKVLWAHDAMTVRQVMWHLHQRGRHVAYTTVLTFLQRLELKGSVKSDRSGVAYIYKPAISRERITGQKLRDVMQLLFDGAAAPMVLQLMQSETFTRSELDQFQQLIDDLETQSDSS